MCGGGDTHVIEQVCGSVRRTSLRYEPSERHTVQNLHQEVILSQSPLAQERSLEEHTHTLIRPEILVFHSSFLSVRLKTDSLQVCLELNVFLLQADIKVIYSIVFIKTVVSCRLV